MDKNNEDSGFIYDWATLPGTTISNRKIISCDEEDVERTMLLIKKNNHEPIEPYKHNQKSVNGNFYTFLWIGIIILLCLLNKCDFEQSNNSHRNTYNNPQNDGGYGVYYRTPGDLD